MLWQTSKCLLCSDISKTTVPEEGWFMESTHTATKSNSAVKQTLWLLASSHLPLSDMWQLAHSPFTLCIFRSMLEGGGRECEEHQIKKKFKWVCPPFSFTHLNLPPPSLSTLAQSWVSDTSLKWNISLRYALANKLMAHRWQYFNDSKDLTPILSLLNCWPLGVLGEVISLEADRKSLSGKTCLWN